MCSICLEYVIGSNNVATSDGHKVCDHCIYLHYCFHCLAPNNNTVPVGDNMFCKPCAEIEIEYLANFIS